MKYVARAHHGSRGKGCHRHGGFALRRWVRGNELAPVQMNVRGRSLPARARSCSRRQALESPLLSNLLEVLKAQPPWSELPLVILTSGGESRRAGLLDLAAAAAGAVTLLERPISTRTLVRSVQVALRFAGANTKCVISSLSSRT